MWTNFIIVLIPYDKPKFICFETNYYLFFLNVRNAINFDLKWQIIIFLKFSIISHNHNNGN